MTEDAERRREGVFVNIYDMVSQNLLFNSVVSVKPRNEDLSYFPISIRSVKCSRFYNLIN